MNGSGYNERGRYAEHCRKARRVTFRFGSGPVGDFRSKISKSHSQTNPCRSHRVGSCIAIALSTARNSVGVQHSPLFSSCRHRLTDKTLLLAHGPVFSPADDDDDGPKSRTRASQPPAFDGRLEIRRPCRTCRLGNSSGPEIRAKDRAGRRTRTIM